MKYNSLHRLVCTLVPACLTLVACGGGGGGGNVEAPVPIAASSTSFSPTTGRDKVTQSQNVALHWIYAVNNGQPVKVNQSGVSIGITFDVVQVKIDPANLRRQVTMQGPVSASFNGTAISGNFSAAIGEDLMFSAGKTVFKNQSAEVNMTFSGGGESGTVKLTSGIGAFAPPYEWLLDRETLDQLPIGHVETITSSGIGDFNITITGEAPIVKSNLPVAISDSWTVLEKLPTMVVRGRSYSNVVKLSRQTRVPDLSGNLTAVTINYWVAKGVGMIRGEGVYRVLNVDDVVYELTETNLSQL